MKGVKLILILFISLGQMSLRTHPFHASITECNFNEETKSLEITLRLFTEDLSQAIEAEIMSDEKMSEEQNQLIENYVLKNLWFQPSGKEKLLLKYIGVERDFDITFVYFEITSFPIVDEYKISQTVFFDQFDDQTNILNLNIRKSTFSDYFTPSEIAKTYKVQ